MKKLIIPTIFLFLPFLIHAQSCTAPFNGCPTSDEWSCIDGQCKPAKCGDGVCNDCSNAFSPCFAETNNCPQDCGGAPSSPAPTPTPTDQFQDTDNGANFYQQGITTGKQGTITITKTDFCQNSQLLNEYSLDSNNNIKTQTVVCNNGCVSGACVKGQICSNSSSSGSELPQTVTIKNLNSGPYGPTDTGGVSYTWMGTPDVSGDNCLASDPQPSGCPVISIPANGVHYYKLVMPTGAPSWQVIVTMGSRNNTMQDIVLSRGRQVTDASYQSTSDPDGAYLNKAAGGRMLPNLTPGEVMYIMVKNVSSKAGQYSLTLMIDPGSGTNSGSSDPQGAIDLTDQNGQNTGLLRNKLIAWQDVQYYKFVLPSTKSSWTVQVTMGTQDWATNQTMMVGYNTAPTKQQMENAWDNGPYSSSGAGGLWYKFAYTSNETFYMYNASPGTYYIAVYNHGGPEGCKDFVCQNAGGKYELVYSAF